MTEQVNVDSNSHPVDITLLPEFELCRTGQPLRLAPTIQRLIAFLALSERPQPRGVVAESLWVDLAESRAAAMLRTTLWQARRAAPGVVVSARGKLALAAGPRVDLWESTFFARAVTTSDIVPDDGHDMLRHDLLPDWSDPWVVLERERFRQLRLHALEIWCRRLTAAGRFATAIEVALGVVAADPLRETAQRVLIEAHLAEGNVSEAIRQYQDFDCALRGALGVAPSPALRALLPSG